MKVKILLLIIGLSATFLDAQTETKAQPEAGIDEITADHQAKITEFLKKVRTLPREEQSELYQKEYPKPDAAVAALKKIIEAEPNNPAIIDAYAWIAKNTRGKGLDTEDYAALKKNHLNNPKLSTFLISLTYSQKEEALNFVQMVSEKSTEKEIRGNALYALAASMKRNKAKATEHAALVDRILKDHPDLTIRGRNVAQSLKTEKEAAIKFAIGKTAPEIIGKDVDGNEMKLSDYKGKVVVLDFWGDW